MTKILSGFFLSQIVQKFSKMNSAAVTQTEFAEQLHELAQSPEALLDIDEQYIRSDTLNLPDFPQERLSAMHRDARATLNASMPWSSYNVAAGLMLGGAYLPHKRAKPHVIPDESFGEVAQLVGENSTVLEVGCFEGHYAATLAMRCKHVYAFDSRMENVLKTLVRTWSLGLDKNVVADVLNIEDSKVSEFYQKYGVENFDLIYHRGVLYHLSDPVSHLADIAPICSALYLNTQYAADEQAQDTFASPHGTFHVFHYREKGVDFAPFAGMVPMARWLRKDELLGLLERLGFQSISVISDVDERNGKRIALIAKK
jgi:tRNA (mo5U34)-methyltransferase